MLCGVKIPNSKGFKAHSDGDVALHALTDAILGACALGDIGRHFPDTDDAYKGIDSRVLLRRVIDLISDKGYQVNNVDITIVAEKPKLANFIDSMCETVASDLAIERGRVSVKATTSERLGFVGREEGIAAQSVVTVLSL